MMPHLLLRSFLLAWALILLSTPAMASPRGSGGMEFGPPPRGPDGKPIGRGNEEEATATQPAQDDPILDEIQDLATWPNRRGISAAETLLLRGPVVVPYMVRILDSKDKETSAIQPGAAWVLGHVGEPSHIPMILRAAAERKNGSRAEAFFEAAYRLDGTKAKRWLFSFLTLRRPVFRQKSTEFLAQHVGPEDQERVLQLLDSDRAGVRIAGLKLLEPAEVPDTDARLTQALSDLSPQVAQSASITLALRADEEIVRRLNTLAVEGNVRERAYATLALVEIARTRDENPFNSNTLAEFAGRRGILHPEKLPRGASAVGLAYGALDSTDESLQGLLDRTVIEVLIDTVGGGHFRDFSSLAEPVFSALRRLSGLDLPTTATAWASWWTGQRGTFQARRPLDAFAAKDLPYAYVTVEAVDPEGRRRSATFRAEDGSANTGDFVIRNGVFTALVGALEEAGIFSSDAVAKPRADEHVVVVLGVLNQRRRLVVPPSDPRYPLIRMRVTSLLEANEWQRYRDIDRWPDAVAWWKTNVEMVEQADPETRRILLRSAIVNAFDDLPSDVARGEALDVLEDLLRQDEGDGGLSAGDARALVEAATTAVAFGGVEERAVRFATMQRASSQVRGDLIEALATRTEPTAAMLLAELLAAGGEASVRDAFADPRASMRLAACRAAQGLLEAGAEADDSAAKLAALQASFRPGLEVLTRDLDLVVATRATIALYHLGDEGAITRLEDIYQTGDMGVKVAVAEALGDIKPDDAYPLLNLLLANERAPDSGLLRATALRSLGRTNHANAVNLLTFYLLNDADAGVRLAAGDALIELRSEDARFALVRALTEGQPQPERRARLIAVLGHFDGQVVQEVMTSYLEDKDPQVAQAAALALARQNIAISVPYLIEIVRSGNPNVAQEALRALEDISLTRFQLTGHDLLAEQYEQWYRTARITVAKDPDRAFFRDALRKRGYDVGPLVPYIAGESDPMAVPLLIRALRDEDALVRRGAAIALRRITALDMGEVTRNTSRRDAAKIADQWARWWSRVEGPKDR